MLSWGGIRGGEGFGELRVLVGRFFGEGFGALVGRILGFRGGLRAFVGRDSGFRG